MGQKKFQKNFLKGSDDWSTSVPLAYVETPSLKSNRDGCVPVWAKKVRTLLFQRSEIVSTDRFALAVKLLTRDFDLIIAGVQQLSGY